MGSKRYLIWVCLGVAPVCGWCASASVSARLAAVSPGASAVSLGSEEMDETLRFVEMPGAKRLPKEYMRMWVRGCEAQREFLELFEASGGAVSEAAWASLSRAADELEALAVFKLDPARQLMLYGKLVEVYGTLSRDASRAARAAQWCVQQAVHPGCSDAYAVDEASAKDAFNSAVSSAITYYRRAGDDARAEATLALANKHPLAATKYDRVCQTPKVYFPELTARRFWDPEQFDVVRRLTAAYEDPATREAMLADLDRLEERGSLERLKSPSAPFLPPSADKDARGAGAWSELPLYDGRRFDEDACAIVPTLSRLLRSPDGTALPEIGAAPDDPTRPNLCGTDVVATVLRLAPGSRILPHCGVTNRRLILQFALRGSDGVTFTVGDEPRGYGGDGHAIVFDDSFEHHVRHDGKEDRFVLFAILKHPDLA